MFDAKFGRSIYLNATILELQVLSKLYGLLPPKFPNYKVNWIDQLMLEHTELPVIDWGDTRESDNSIEGALFQTCIMDAWDALGNFNAHPSLIERAIIAKLIEVRDNSFDSRDASLIRILGKQGINLELSELELLRKLEVVYKLKAVMEQVIDLMKEM